jgi:hypothetical protein
MNMFAIIPVLTSPVLCTILYDAVIIYVCSNEISGKAFNKDIWSLIGSYAFGEFTWICFPSLSIAVNDPILPHDLGHPNRMDFGANTVGIWFDLILMIFASSQI